MDIVTAAVAAGGYLGLKDLVPRILGPTADYIGGELKSYTEKGTNNLRRIFANAGEKLGKNLETDGEVPAKVLKNILNEGYYCEDKLTGDYFGGVLASSRSGISRDDRGAVFAALIGRLSSYQIRSHHILYMTAKLVHDGKDVNVMDRGKREKSLKTYISFDEFAPAMDIEKTEEDPNVIIGHVFNGLSREGLIEDSFSYGSGDFLKKYHGVGVLQPGIVYTPSALGIELHLWAYGKGQKSLSTFLNTNTLFSATEGIKYPQSIIRIKD